MQKIAIAIPISFFIVQVVTNQQFTLHFLIFYVINETQLSNTGNKYTCIASETKINRKFAIIIRLCIH